MGSNPTAAIGPFVKKEGFFYLQNWEHSQVVKTQVCKTCTMGSNPIASFAGLEKWTSYSAAEAE